MNLVECQERIAKLTAENVYLFRQLSKQERFNMESRRSLCNQRDNALASLADTERRMISLVSELKDLKKSLD